MAIAYLSVSAKTAGSGTTGALDSSGASGANGMLILGAVGPGNTYCSGQDSKSNTWTNGTVQSDNVTPQYVGLDHVIGPASVGTGHTFTTTTNIFFSGIVAACFSGVDSFDKQSGAINVAGTSHNGTTGSITPTNADSLLVAICSFATDPGTVTVPTGFTLIDTVSPAANMPISMAYMIQSGGPSAETPVWGTTNSIRTAATVSVYKPAAGGGGGRATKNTRSWPLGVEIGMGWRM